jgi:hypothetical protein
MRDDRIRFLADVPVPTTLRSLFVLACFSIVGLRLVGQRFRIDVVRCTSWPPVAERLLLCGLFLVCVGLLWFAWQRLLRLSEAGQVSFRAALGVVLACHGAALLVPPFLSDDPLFYVAIGRALHTPHATAQTPLLEALGPQDEVLKLLPAHWQIGTSAYQTGFHALAWAIEAIPNLSVSGRLSVYQGLSCAAVVGASVLAAQCSPQANRPRSFGLLFVGLSPLALVEGTVSAHNDVWLLLLWALVAFLWTTQPSRAKRAWALGLVPLGLAVKLSAALPAGLWGVSLVRKRFPKQYRLLHWGAGVLCVAGALLLWAAHTGRLGGQVSSVLLGSRTLPWDLCTRSLECLPRAVLRYVFLRADASYAVGLLVRLLAGLWLVKVAWTEANALSAVGVGVFGYFLYFHGWAQTWYFLPVLPLWLFLSPRRRRAFEVLCLSGCGYYALALFRNCVVEPWQVAVCELVEGVATVLPPTVAWVAKEKPC